MEQEYILGDWVLLNGRKAFVFQTYTDADETFVYIINDEEYKAKDLKGIPLTPGILEKNGWVWSDEHEELTFGTAPIAIYPESNYFIVYELRLKLRYVHQLQHLLFGLGIKHEMEV